MTKKFKLVNLSATALMVLIFLSCREVSTPKPRGHFRIDLPPKAYRSFDPGKHFEDLPLTFEYPVYGNLVLNSGPGNEKGWFNIEFPAYHASIYLTYVPVGKDFAALMEQTYRMNIKNHITKADAISEQAFSDSNRKVYGILYDLKGNTASSVQFYVTDSVRNFLRGSLYFDAEPDADSLSPVIGFFRQDIVHLIETVKWNN